MPAGQVDGGWSACSSFAGQCVCSLPSTRTAGNFWMFNSLARAAFSGFEMSRIERLPCVDSVARWFIRLMVSLHESQVFVKISSLFVCDILASMGLGLLGFDSLLYSYFCV